MKVINISLDELDSSLPRIWEFCAGKGWDMTMSPAAGSIDISKEGKKIAKICVIAVTSAYDVTDALGEE